MQMNARSESVAEKPAFKRLLERRRCLVPTNGFYEWRQEATAKQPYHVHFGQDSVMVLAGLFDSWEAPGEAEPLYTYTLLTTDSTKPLKW